MRADTGEGGDDETRLEEVVEDAVSNPALAESPEGRDITAGDKKAAADLLHSGSGRVGEEPQTGFPAEQEQILGALIVDLLGEKLSDCTGAHIKVCIVDLGGIIEIYRQIDPNQPSAGVEPTHGGSKIPQEVADDKNRTGRLLSSMLAPNKSFRLAPGIEAGEESPSIPGEDGLSVSCFFAA